MIFLCLQLFYYLENSKSNKQSSFMSSAPTSSTIPTQFVLMQSQPNMYPNIQQQPQQQPSVYLQQPSYMVQQQVQQQVQQPRHSHSQPAVTPSNQPPNNENMNLTPALPPTINVKLITQNQEFSSGICDCCVDVSGCIFGCLCPCWLFGKNVQNLSNRSCCSHCLCYICCGPCNHSPYRRMLRIKYNLDAEPCNDCCVALVCPCCALCQEAREIVYQTDKAHKQQHPNLLGPQKARM